MFGWFKLLGLRAKTLAVIELEYRHKLQIAGGPDTAAFNAVTRGVARNGGNEYDAGMSYMAAAVAALSRQGLDDGEPMKRFLTTTIRLLPLMRHPKSAEAVMDRVVSRGDFT